MRTPFTFLSFAIGVTVAYETVNVNISQPQTNAPLNTSLAYYNMAGLNGNLTRGSSQTLCGSSLSFHYTEPSVWGNKTGTPDRPILILTHGYPESSYIWRELTGNLSQRVPLFVPSQPGYGSSTPCCNETGCAYDKRTYAQAIMEAVANLYGGTKCEPTSVIFAGHDRGARTMHRAAVDNNFTGIDPLGVFVADIVPFEAEYASFANPTDAVGYFHWAFLPRGETQASFNATASGKMLMHFGRRVCDQCPHGVRWR